MRIGTRSAGAPKTSEAVAVAGGLSARRKGMGKEKSMPHNKQNGARAPRSETTIKGAGTLSNARRHIRRSTRTNDNATRNEGGLARRSEVRIRRGPCGGKSRSQAR